MHWFCPNTAMQCLFAHRYSKSPKQLLVVGNCDRIYRFYWKRRNDGPCHRVQLQVLVHYSEYIHSHGSTFFTKIPTSPVYQVHVLVPTLITIRKFLSRRPRGERRVDVKRKRHGRHQGPRDPFHPISMRPITMTLFR